MLTLGLLHSPHVRYLLTVTAYCFTGFIVADTSLNDSGSFLAEAALVDGMFVADLCFAALEPARGFCVGVFKPGR